MDRGRADPELNTAMVKFFLEQSRQGKPLTVYPPITDGDRTIFQYNNYQDKGKTYLDRVKEISDALSD